MPIKTPPSCVASGGPGPDTHDRRLRPATEIRPDQAFPASTCTPYLDRPDRARGRPVTRLSGLGSPSPANFATTCPEPGSDGLPRPDRPVLGANNPDSECVSRVTETRGYDGCRRVLGIDELVRGTTAPSGTPCDPGLPFTTTDRPETACLTSQKRKDECDKARPQCKLKATRRHVL